MSQERSDKGKTVLMVLYYFPPAASGGTYRPLKFIRYLADFGWRTVVIAPLENRFSASDRFLLQEIPYGTEIIRVKPGVEGSWHYPIVRKLGFGSLYDKNLIPDRHIGFVENAVDAGRERIKLGDIDMLFTSAPPYSIHLAGQKLSEETKIPWVADFRDPWVACPFYKPIDKDHDRKYREIEKSYFEKASAVIAFPEIRAEREWGRYPESAKKILPIDNGFDPADFPSEVASPQKTEFRISHVGAITADRPVTVFLDALSKVVGSDIQLKRKANLVFMGDSRPPTPGDVSRFGLADITEFKGYVSHRDACSAMVSSNLLFMVLPDKKGAEGIMPLRLFEYVYSKTPVFLVAPQGEASKFLQETKAGIWVEPSDVTAIASKLGDFIHQIESGKYVHNPVLDILKKHERKYLTSKLAGLFDRILKGEPVIE